MKSFYLLTKLLPLLLIIFTFIHCSTPYGSSETAGTGRGILQIKYTASIEVRDVNLEICHDAAVSGWWDNEPDSGRIKIDAYFGYYDDDLPAPTWRYKTARVWIHRKYYFQHADSTKFQIVDIPLKKGNEYPLYMVRFDIPKPLEPTTTLYTAKVEVRDAIDQPCINAAMLDSLTGIFDYADQHGNFFLSYRKDTDSIWDSTNTVKLWMDISVDSIFWKGKIPIRKGLYFLPFTVTFGDTLY